MNQLLKRSGLAVLLLMGFSCQQQPAKTETSKVSSQAMRPDTFSLSQLPDSLQPHKFLFKDKPPKSISLRMQPMQPLKPAQLNITRFATDNELVTNGVPTGFLDSHGNVWFGTVTKGASYFNGKEFVNFTVADGLASNIVWSVFEDRDGNMWFGTRGGGISVYDGIAFKSYSTEDGLAGSHVYSVAQDDSGKMWIGTMTGLSVFDGKKFESYKEIDSRFGQFVDRVYNVGSGKMLVSLAGQGIALVDGKNRTFYNKEDGLNSNEIHVFFKDKAGVIWIGTQQGLCAFDGKQFLPIPELGTIGVWSITQDYKGNLWFGCDNGIYVFDGKNYTRYTSENGLPESSVRVIIADRSGNIWVGTQQYGVARFNGPATKTYEKEDWQQRAPVGAITSIDGEEGIFVGSFVDGLFKIKDGQYARYETGGKFLGVVNSVCKGRNNDFWVGSESNGLIHYQDGNARNYTLDNGLISPYFYSLYQDGKNNLWATSRGGVNKIDEEGITQYTAKQGLRAGIFWSVIEDREGDIWMGTAGQGLFRFNGRSFINYTKENSGLASNTVWAASRDAEGNLWFGTDAGLMRYDGNDFFMISKSNGMMDEVVYGIVFDKKGRMAVGTNLGISVLNGFADQAGAAISEEKILPQNKLANQSLRNKAFLWQHYNLKTGYPIKSINGGVNNHGALDFDEDGILWISTNRNDLIALNLDTVNKNPNPPVVIIEDVKINGEQIPWYTLKPELIPIDQQDSSLNIEQYKENFIGQQEHIVFQKVLSEAERESLFQKFSNIKFASIQKWTSVPGELVLPYKNNGVSFDFNAIETGEHQLVRYQYALVTGHTSGKIYERDWSVITEKDEAVFTNLFEGDYTFAVRACNQDGVWSSPVLYSFKVKPPWFRTWWMYVLYIAMLVAVVTLIMRWRENALKKQNELLEKQVERRTHQLNLEKQKSDNLLINILPQEVAEELKETGKSEARHFENVSVLFTDFVNFTKLSASLTAEELLDELNEFFTAFDKIIEEHGLEKIKTIGDAYMAVCGLPKSNERHAQNTVAAALEIVEYINEKRKELNHPLGIRAGINSGHLVAGIVGVKKFAYDVWGDTVNTASRMESNSEDGKVNISQSTYELIKDEYDCFHRGKIVAKGKGEVDMYYVSNKK